MAATRRLKPEDLFLLRLVGEPDLSPDGRKVAYTETRLDRESNEYRSRIRLFDLEDGTGLPITGGPRDRNPKWSPDGRFVAFLADREGTRQQLWLLPADGGEAWALTRYEQSVSDFAWSPDGRHLAFTARVDEEGLKAARAGSEQPGDGGRSAEAGREAYTTENLREKYTGDVKLIRRLFYKLDSVGFLAETRSQIFILDLGPSPVSREEPTVRQLTSGDYDHESPAWSPDGRAIAFHANRREDADYHPSVSDIFVVASGGGEPRRLTDGVGSYYSPSWSPDGRIIAYLGHRNEYFGYTNHAVWVAPAEGGEARNLTPDATFCAGDQAIDDLRGHGAAVKPAWSPDGRHLHFLASLEGRVQLYRVEVGGSGAQDPADPPAGPKTAAAVTSGDQVIYAFSLGGAGAVLAVTDTTRPGDLFWLPFKGESDGGGRFDRDVYSGSGPSAAQPLTDANGSLLSQVALSRPERFRFRAEGGPETDGWLMRPVGYKEGRRYPAVLEVHGGPMAMYGDSFFFEFQLLAAAGYNVVYTNPRGSLGYGQEFCRAIQRDWGNKDYADVLAGLDKALSLGGIEPSRVGIAGGSYGGFMTNWAIGHTDRFRAAVTMRSVVNEYSFFGTSDFGYTLADEDYKVHPWEDPGKYLGVSPFSSVERIRTPLLIIHSEEDYRCPMEQAEQLYVALKKLGRPVEFLRFPGESHELSRSGKPWHRVFRLEKIVEWFERYL